MSKNVEIIKRFYYEIWNQGRKEIADEILAPKLQFRGSTGPCKNGISGFLGYVDMIRNSLSDYNCTINEVVSEGNSSFAKMTFTGKHTGTFFGVPPDAKLLTWNGAALFKFEADKICEIWVLGDIDSLKQQLGLVNEILP